MATRFNILSGQRPGDSGTGRLVTHVRQEIARYAPSFSLVTRPDPPVAVPTLVRRRRWGQALQVFIGHAGRELWFRLGLRAVRRRVREPLLVLHPQTLGFRNFLELVDGRILPATLFLLDSSFFCIASYNHLLGENRPCMRCVGGDFKQARRHECEPFPKPDPTAHEYVIRILDLVKQGRIRIVAQNARQAELAQRHFGLSEPPAVVGLWTKDWDPLLETARTKQPVAMPEQTQIVFHGFDLDAKGAAWLEKVAEHIPRRRFIFPFPRPAKRTPPRNCEYKPMTWETGLEDAVSSAQCVVVPSLWSAPIEGSLVKSIVLSRRVAVTENDSSYVDELPDGLVLRLHADPAKAGPALDRALNQGWKPDPNVKAVWLAKLSLQRHEFLERLLSAVYGGMEA